MVIWGTGTPRREFLYVDDMAAASIFVMNLDKAIYDREIESMQSHINVGSGSDITINELANVIAKTIGYKGSINFDATKPDGSPRKLMSSKRLNYLGWQPQIDLERGLENSYAQFLLGLNRNLF